MKAVVCRIVRNEYTISDKLQTSICTWCFTFFRIRRVQTFSSRRRNIGFTHTSRRNKKFHAVKNFIIKIKKGRDSESFSHCTCWGIPLLNSALYHWRLIRMWSAITVWISSSASSGTVIAVTDAKWKQASSSQLGAKTLLLCRKEGVRAFLICTEGQSIFPGIIIPFSTLALGTEQCNGQAKSNTK